MRSTPTASGLQRELSFIARGGQTLKDLHFPLLRQEHRRQIINQVSVVFYKFIDILDIVYFPVWLSELTMGKINSTFNGG